MIHLKPSDTIEFNGKNYFVASVLTPYDFGMQNCFLMASRMIDQGFAAEVLLRVTKDKPEKCKRVYLTEDGTLVEGSAL